VLSILRKKDAQIESLTRELQEARDNIVAFRSQSGQDVTAPNNNLHAQQRNHELKALREKTADQAEQIEVRYVFPYLSGLCFLLSDIVTACDVY
jgi:predicted RNase H-like nuclease (RuvC/YqgF family)